MHQKMYNQCHSILNCSITDKVWVRYCYKFFFCGSVARVAHTHVRLLDERLTDRNLNNDTLALSIIKLLTVIRRSDANTILY